MNKITLLLILFFIVSACNSSQKSKEENANQEVVEVKTDYPTTGSIERLDDAINELIPENARIEILAEGFNWSEGPVWLATEGMLIFSDVPENIVYQWKEGEEKAIYLEPSGYQGETSRGGEMGSNGLLLNSAGKLVLCQHGDRRLAVMDAPLSAPQSKFSTLVDNYQGKKFNSPNDAAFHKNGDIYFTDPPYGLEERMEDPLKEINFQGVYKADAAGNAELLTDELTRPNGIAFSPDYQTLYVANSDPEKAIWMAYDVKDDGSVENGRVFFDATEWVGEKKGLPDGFKVNNDGYLFASGPGGILIFSPEGKHLGTINTGESTSNCAFGNDGAYLYMTADMYLMRVKLK
jgi:gluconolactonase